MGIRVVGLVRMIVWVAGLGGGLIVGMMIPGDRGLLAIKRGLGIGLVVDKLIYIKINFFVI